MALLKEQQEEMIALGVSYGINCQFCIEYHHEKALEAGLSNKQILAAISIAEAVKNGAANKTKKITKDLIGKIPETECCPADNSCCAE